MVSQLIALQNWTICEDAEGLRTWIALFVFWCAADYVGVSSCCYVVSAMNELRKCVTRT